MIGLAKTKPAPQVEQPQQIKQSLLLDGFRRIEEHSPVWMLPRLVTTLNLHKHLAQARQRLCDSHRAMMKDAGVDVQSCDDGISVQGDTTINNHGLKTLGTVAAILLALIIGALLMLLLPKQFGAATTSTTSVNLNGIEPPAQSVANWRLGLKVTDQP